MSTTLEPIDEDAVLPDHKPPFLRRVRIRGYKSIAFCDVTLEPLTILVGRNGSGKSNFLDALAFVRDVAVLGFSEAVRLHGGWRSVRSRIPPADVTSFEFEISPVRRRSDVHIPSNPVSFGFTFHSGPDGTVVRSAETYANIEQSSSKAIYDLKGKYDPANEEVQFHYELASEFGKFEVPLPHPDLLWLGAFAQEPLRSAFEGLRSIQSYDFSPERMRQLQESNPSTYLRKDGSNLPALVDHLFRVDLETYGRIGEYLSTIIPEVVSYRSARYGDTYGTIQFELTDTASGTSRSFDSAQMSDGTLRVLAALVAAFQNFPPLGSPSLVGIEEPETSLHPAAMNALVDALNEATLRTQVLITTHSTELLDNANVRPENVRVVQMVDGRTVIGPVDSSSVEIVKRGLNTLGGREREDHLEIDFQELERQRNLETSNGEFAQ